MALDRSQCDGWMHLAASGDAAAFGELASAAQDALYRFALAQGLAPADAAEAVQETLLRAYAGRGRWRDDGDAVAWLLGITMNVVREFRRRRRQWPAQGLQETFADAGDAEPDEDDMHRLAEAIDALPPRQREAVACRYLRRMSVRETAQVMGCAEGTVRAAVFAALRNLRDALGHDRE